jgi:hypothetical protein
MLARVVLSTVILQSALSAAVVTHSWREGILDLKLDDGSARLEWISPVTFRVFRRWDSGAIDSSVVKHDPVLVALDEADPVLKMTTRYLTVEVSKSDPTIQVRNGSTPIASISMERRKPDIEIRFSPMDHVYGLGGGESPTLDLRGRRVEQARGFFYTNKGYGVYLPAKETVAYDLATGRGLLRNADQIEFAFYHGGAPKEILEQHLIVAGQTEVTLDSLPLLRQERVPKEATKLADKKIDSWAALGDLVRTLNHESLSAVLYPALDVSTIDGPEAVRQRALDLAAILPLIYRSRADSPAPDRATRDAFRPYLATYLREAHDRGFPLIHPFAMQFSRDAGSDQQANVFLLGDELLVAPVLGEGDKLQVKLPRGLWTDLRTNKEYGGNQTVEVDAPPGRVPMFARNGSLFPLSAVGKMELHYLPSLGGEFFLWEPDEDDNSQFHAAPAGEFMRVEVESKLTRTYEWVLHHTKTPKEVAEESGTYSRANTPAERRAGVWWHDDERDDLHILMHVEARTDRIVNVSF